MKILVTGDQGYIGAVLVKMLAAHGHDVKGTDMGYFRLPGGEADWGEAEFSPRDIRDLAITDLAGFDAVIHLAALSNDPLGNLKPEWTYEINHQASVRLAEIAKAAGVPRFLFSSSCSVYGMADSAGLVNEQSPVHPLTTYAISKVRSEQDISALADGSFSPVFLRNATAYGWSPSFRADLVLNNLAAWAFTSGEIRMLSDGTPWRPIVHVEDIARAFVTLVEAPREIIHNQIFNIGSNQQNYQVKELAGFVQQAFPGCRLTYAENAGPDPRSYRVDFCKISRLVPAFQPIWNAESGAHELAKAYSHTGLTREDFNGPRYTRLKCLQELLGAGRLDGDLRWVDGHNPAGEAI